MLKEAFLNLEINEGDILMVHSSISSLGYVIGGVEALYESLILIVGNKGTMFLKQILCVSFVIPPISTNRILKHNAKMFTLIVRSSIRVE
ncbi:AAC(3) family N-acetyltransferase [Streptococcus suis]|nr:AAC(3) family N-acetyltransferase [Streptococcus suis]